MNKLKFTVFIPAYNEEANIGNLLNSISRQRFARTTLEKIVVVASGCTDKTEAIVRRQAANNKLIALWRQTERSGKISAINLFLRQDKSQLTVMTGADLLLSPDCLERLILPFTNPVIGMTGAKIISTNSEPTFLGFANRTIWQMHARMAVKYPRLGEIVAFRRIFKSLPADTICDEAAIESLIKNAGLKTLFVPQALAYNYGPTTWKEYLSRRRNIHVGHYLIKRKWKQAVISEKKFILLKYWWRQFAAEPENRYRLLKLIIVEAATRLLAAFDYRRGRHEVVWPVARSAKKPVSKKQK